MSKLTWGLDRPLFLFLLIETTINQLPLIYLRSHPFNKINKWLSDLSNLTILID